MDHKAEPQRHVKGTDNDVYNFQSLPVERPTNGKISRPRQYPVDEGRTGEKRKRRGEPGNRQRSPEEMMCVVG